MRIAALDRAQLAEIQRVLEAACAFDRASVVAEEKLFGATHYGTTHAFGAWDGDVLVGVAGVCSKWLRVLAVEPSARRRGAGSALLEACCDAARADGETQLRTLDQPGNYLAPGVDVRNVETLAWLDRRGFARKELLRANAIVAVRDNPRVTAARAESLATAARERGFEIRRGARDETALLEFVASAFGGAWSFEVAAALRFAPPAVHVALKDGAYCAFAAHDGNNAGLGWFGPTGTLPELRGQGLGEVLLVACLVDVARDHARCEVAWIGPRPFYDKVAGVVEDRAFVLMMRAL